MADRILGIVHGVMPAIGAPATYKRFRAGFESAEQVILGRNAPEATAVMANAPGPLELLPTAEYKTKTAQGYRHWLRASYLGTNPQGQPQEQEVFLGEEDPYANIYLNNSEAWWKLVKENLIDPAAREEREKARRKEQKMEMDDPENSDFEKFVFNMEKAAELHANIEGKYHPNTYAYYAADPKRLAWNEVLWRCKSPVTGDLKSALLGDDNFNGRVHLFFDEKNSTSNTRSKNQDLDADQNIQKTEVSSASNIEQVTISSKKFPMKKQKFLFEIQDGIGPGDGTVPEESGAAPTPHVTQIFRHEGKAKGYESYDHQDSYKAKIVQTTTLYSIAKIVAESDWLKGNVLR